MKKLLLALFILNGLLAYSQAPGISAKFGKGVKFTAADSSFSVKIGARFQTLFYSNFVLDDNNTTVEEEMQIRRCRLKFSGFAYSPRLQYKLELALSNRDNGKVIPEGNSAANIVLDAFLTYEMFKEFYVRFGQFKLPGNRERVISSQKLQFVDRSLVNSRYNLDRDQGLMFIKAHNIGGVRIYEYLAAALGQGRNITESDSHGFSYTGRIEVLPFGDFTKGGDYYSSDLEREQTPKLALAAGYSFNDDAVRERGELGSFITTTDVDGDEVFVRRDLSTFFADAYFKYKGFSFLSEYMNKRTADPITDNGKFFRTGDGLVMQAGYLFKNNYELAARYTFIHPDEELIDGGIKVYDETEYTLGLSKYIVGHSLKVQSDISYHLKENDIIGDASPSIIYRFQVELAF